MKIQLGKSNYAPLFAALAVLVSLVLCVIFYTPRALESFAEQQAILYAQKEVKKIGLLINYYNEHIGDKVNMSDDLRLAIGHQGDNKKLPVPFTFVVEVNQAYKELSDNFSVYSPYPFEGRVRDVVPFDSEAWNALNPESRSYYMKREKVDGREWVNIAVPQTMTAEACVSCHNAHPQSIKKDWEVGQLRAIFKTRISLDAARAKGNEIAVAISIALTIVASLALVLFYLFFHRKKSEDAFRKLALSDQLTSLQNRYSLQASISTLFENGAEFALLYIDLDGFKQVNDTYGHDAGDYVLKVASKRMNSAVSGQGVAFRLGGDEFAIILDQLHDPAGIRQLAEKVLKNVSRPVEFKGKNLKVGCSIGGALSRFAKNPEQLIKSADEAMYKSKEGGKNKYTLSES